MLLIGDFNTEISESRIESLFYEHKLYNLVKEKTRSKSVHNPNCVDFPLTNNAMALQNTTTFFTLKTSITKSKPQNLLIETKRL